MIVKWLEQEELLLDIWIAVVFLWLQPNAKTAVWSNILVWLEKQRKVLRVIKSRLRLLNTVSATYSSEETESSSCLGNKKIQGTADWLQQTGLGVMLNSTRYLTTRVKKRLCRPRERSSLHAEDPNVPHTCKRFPQKNVSQNSELLRFSTERSLVGDEDKRKNEE